ncbi:MAG TPA: hypothetical protein VFW35_11080 [Sphingomicrobium sp.]|nr:hypothetical protein [Sphingomicrobium sp.]
MSLLAPIIAGVFALVAGLAVLIWMNRNQPVLKASTSAPEPEEQPSLANIWAGKAPVDALKTPGYGNIVVHHE